MITRKSQGSERSLKDHKDQCCKGGRMGPSHESQAYFPSKARIVYIFGISQQSSVNKMSLNWAVGLLGILPSKSPVHNKAIDFI